MIKTLHFRWLETGSRNTKTLTLQQKHLIMDTTPIEEIWISVPTVQEK